GAGGPLIVSAIADATNLRIGMLFILVFVVYVTAVALWAHPLINNKTVPLNKLFSKE
ncbi:MAG: MFS transporter, partial [Bacteroides sp.]